MFVLASTSLTNPLPALSRAEAPGFIGGRGRPDRHARLYRSDPASEQQRYRYRDQTYSVHNSPLVLVSSTYLPVVTSAWDAVSLDGKEFRKNALVTFVLHFADLLEDHGSVLSIALSFTASTRAWQFIQRVVDRELLPHVSKSSLTGGRSAFVVNFRCDLDQRLDSPYHRAEFGAAPSRESPRGRRLRSFVVAR